MKKLWLLAIAALFFSSCATYKLQYSKKAKDWEAARPDSAHHITHSMYLIGDAGDKPYMTPALKLLKNKLSAASENSSVVFLGDNIYPGGMPPKSEKEARKDAELRINAQLSTLENFKGRPLFITGNHDTWYYKTAGVERQMDYINKYLNRDVKDKDDWVEYYLPEGNCPGPEDLELDDKLVVIAINTQWYLMEWSKDPDINYDCETKTRDAFAFWFEETLRKYRNKNVVVVMHHPVHSYSTHGGNFTWKEHIFPLTELSDNFYLPLPVIGSIGTFVRSAIGLRQDLANPLYREMRSDILSAAKKNGNFIFAAGHDHCLQYIEKGDQYFVHSGAGSKDSPVALGQGSLFAYGHYGFAQLDFYDDGSVWVTYWSPEEGYPNGRKVFSHKVKDALPLADPFEEEEVVYPSNIPDSVTTTISTRNIEKKGALHTLLYGSLYRDLYRDTLTFPAMVIDTFRGGVGPVKVGGGGQTNSLRLEYKGESRKQYNMRSTTKDASRFIPYPFNQLAVARNLVEESFLAAHPFAATALPPMAEAINIYHTDPRMYYIPKQPGLKEYNDLFGDEVYQVVERPDDEAWQDAPQYDYPDDLISTEDVVGELRKSEKHIIDQGWVARSRLFDLVIGDWDRHDDQWRWIDEEKDDIHTYRPVPRDRDQAFSRYDGLVNNVARFTMPFLKQLRNYKKEIGNIKWSTYNGRQFDKAFLNQLEWEDWEKELEYIQANLTDDVVEAGFARWPEKVRQTKRTHKIMETLRYRRDNLREIARTFYEHLAKEVEVTGTNDPDWFVVERDDKTTRVRVWEMKDGEKKDLMYDRTFQNKETQEIRLFGFEDDDRFEVVGEAGNGIRVRLIGGEGKDIFNDASRVRGWGRKTKIHDSAEGNIIDPGKEAEDLTSPETYFNQYHRRDPHYEYDFFMTFPQFGFNPDDGLFLGARVDYTHYAYKKAPYAQRHSVWGQYAFATGAYEFGYRGEFLEGIGPYDFTLNLQAQGPKFVVNYFGFGNDSENPLGNNDDLDFNRVRQSLFRIQPALRKRFGSDNGQMIFGLSAERYDVESTPGRFVTSDASDLPPSVFQGQYFAGAFFGVKYENVNNTFRPTTGLKFHTRLDWRNHLDNGEQFAQLDIGLTFYQSFFRNNFLTLASQVGWIHNFGDFAFYQAPTLGGNDNLRGYRTQRFYGKTAFFHNSDLRLKLLDSNHNGLASFSLGLTGGFDYGRVWVEDDQSDTWHNAYGGGLWIAPLDYFVILGELFHSKEGNRVTVKLGFSF